MKIGQLKLGTGGLSVGLSNNQLKIIAMFAMACDHVGKALLPGCVWLQMIGRISFPIFAYMIAEGCHHTKHKWRYWLHLAVLSLGCQLVYFFMMDSLYMSVLVTFSVSILLIYAIDFFWKRKNVWTFLLMLVAFGGAFFLAEGITMWFPQSGYLLDYGLYGVMFPVVVYCMPGVWAKLGGSSVMLTIKAFLSGGIHWYGFFTLPLLLLYNGERGKHKLKYLFYIFYPTHLALIYLLQMILIWLADHGA